jgi:hypothetical protein
MNLERFCLTRRTPRGWCQGRLARQPGGFFFAKLTFIEPRVAALHTRDKALAIAYKDTTS